MPETAARLAADPALLEDHYDVAIVGSGYGGAITAARLAFAAHQAGRKLRIAVLERGDEHPTGTGPKSEVEFIKQVRSPVNPLGFYEISNFDTIDVICGCGLGGTSLNNLNVAIAPDREVFLQYWPRAFRREVERSPDGLGGLEEYYGRARRMLGAIPWRTGQDLAKAGVFDEIAGHAGMIGEPLEIVVSAEDRITRYGVRRRACTNCGDCSMICNVGAKNTLMTNYLPMAQHFGARLFTRIEVDRVASAGDEGYRLHCRRRSGARGRKVSDRVITAKRVVLSAGSLGTTGILLRSRALGLALSPRLGEDFSGNGDNFAVAYNTDRVTDSQGFGMDTGPRSSIKPGPSITSIMRFGADQPDLGKRFTVEDLTAPSALIDSLRIALMGLAAIEHPDWHVDRVNRWRKDLEWNTDGALNHSLAFLIMAHDSSDGRIVLNDDGSLGIEWPGAPDERIYGEIDELLTAAAKQIDGSYITNPVWSSPLLGNNLLTAHPLGGCATADSVEYGVVDHRGRVFNPDGGVHKGLYVIDGSVMPRALAVNPLLTISMFTERAAEHLRRELRLPAYDGALEGDDRAPTPANGRRRGAGIPANDEEAVVTATLSGVDASARTPVKPTTGNGSIADRVAELRADAPHDPVGVQEEMWDWIKQLGAKHDTKALEQLFEVGTPPRGLDGPTDGILVTTVVNPLIDLPVRLVTSLWMPWRGKVLDARHKTGLDRLTADSGLPAVLLWPLYAIRDELVELVPNTHLGRILFRLPALRGERFTNVGYFALRQPAASG
ncbi:MAG: cholesterol oxidase [Solirubrobacteraceae bacterium]|nr:cholesterol oxidase [Solirubrobacteraceae bacterium]